MKVDEETKKELRKSLEKEKKILEEELSRFATKDPKTPGDWDTRFPQIEDRPAEPQGNAPEVAEYDKLLAVEYALETRLKEVTEALSRIETPEYGLCQKCNQPIPIERLKANPAATTCLKC